MSSTVIEPEIEAPWEPSFMRLSPSKINTYKKCPREFYYKYIADSREENRSSLSWYISTQGIRKPF